MGKRVISPELDHFSLAIIATQQLGRHERLDGRTANGLENYPERSFSQTSILEAQTDFVWINPLSG
jgi:hypothetical protein